MRGSHRAVRGGRHRRSSPWRTAAAFLVVALTVAGGGLLAAAVTVKAPRPPQPAANAAPPDLSVSRSSTPERAGDAVMARSVPVRITIPEIGVEAGLIPLGVDDDGEVEVPPLDRAMEAGWYKYGPTPGEIGNAVIVGHVDSRTIGPAVFFELGTLKPGDSIEVVRKDSSVARFRVDGVGSFPKDEFPAEPVYGPSDRPGLRVVTCGGRYDKDAGGYLGNVIVFATLRT